MDEHKIHVNFGPAIPEPQIRGVPKLKGNGYRTFNIGRIRLKFFLWVSGKWTNTKYMSKSVRRFRNRRFAGSRGEMGIVIKRLILIGSDIEFTPYPPSIFPTPIAMVRAQRAPERRKNVIMLVYIVVSAPRGHRKKRISLGQNALRAQKGFNVLPCKNRDIKRIHKCGLHKWKAVCMERRKAEILEE